MKKEKDNMSKCYFCENKATVSVWGEMLIRICDDCWKEAVSHLKEKKDGM